MRQDRIAKPSSKHVALCLTLRFGSRLGGDQTFHGVRPSANGAFPECQPLALARFPATSHTPKLRFPAESHSILYIHK